MHLAQKAPNSNPYPTYQTCTAMQQQCSKTTTWSMLFISAVPIKKLGALAVHQDAKALNGNINTIREGNFQSIFDPDEKRSTL